MASSKFHHGKTLQGGTHKEAPDLWAFSASQMHPASGVKDTIANYVSLGQRKNMESLPYGGFKSGVIPHPFMTASIDPHAEPTTQPLAGRLIPLELAGLQNVGHLLPPDYMHDAGNKNYSSGRDDILRAGKTRRYKTSYASQSGRSVPYRRSDRSSTTLTTSSSAQGSMSNNSGLNTAGGGGPPVTDKSLDQLVGDSPNALITKSNLEAVKRLSVKFAKFAAGKGPAVSPFDADVITLTTAGLSPAALKGLIDKVPALKAIPGIETLVRALGTKLAMGLSLADMFSAVMSTAKRFKEKPKTTPGPTTPAPAPPP